MAALAVTGEGGDGGRRDFVGCWQDRNPEAFDEALYSSFVSSGCLPSRVASTVADS